MGGVFFTLFDLGVKNGLRICINRIIKDKLNIREEVRITTVARLGKRNEETNRLVKVVFETLNMKKLVLRNATRMRQLDEDDPDHLVYIRPDLTKL